MKTQTEGPTTLNCTECGESAFIGYAPSTITRGKNKGKEKPSWGGLVQPGEHLCTRCFVRRGGKSVF